MSFRTLWTSSNQLKLERKSHVTTVPSVAKDAIPWSLIQSYGDHHPEQREELSSFVKQRLLKEPPKMDSTLSADVCDDCGVQMMVIANDSMLACSRCAKTRVITSANAWSSALDADFSTLHATQKSRVLEWLEFVQAKEYGDIDEALLKQVCAYLVDHQQTGLENPRVLQIIRDEYLKNGPYADSESALARLSAQLDPILSSSSTTPVTLEQLLKKIDHVMVRNALKSLSGEARKFSERSAKISSVVSGFYPERLTSQQEEYIRKLFMTATPVYNRYRKTAQPNWPGGYPYFLRSLLILLGWDEIAAHFPHVLANRNTEREEQRREIWSLLKWDFVPCSGPLEPVALPDGSILNGHEISEVDRRSK